METNLVTNSVNPVPATRVYWILDNHEKAYFKRDVLKTIGAYFVREHSSWCIDNPSEKVRELVKLNGLILQFRKYKG